MRGCEKNFHIKKALAMIVQPGSETIEFNKVSRHFLYREQIFVIH